MMFLFLQIMEQNLIRELIFIYSRSSGPGGQHVNRTESKVELHWNLESSALFSDQEKLLLKERLGRRLTAGGMVIFTCQATRSQLRNKEIVQQRFMELIRKSLQPARKRIPTRATRSAVEKRLKEKKARGEKKQLRRGGRNPDL